MANTDAAFGFRPYRHATGGQVRMNEYSIASAYNTNIFNGDVVEMTGTGKNIAKVAAANADNIGVFAGCRYVDASGNQVFSKYWPANTVATDIKAYVFDDPKIIFECQCDTLAEADIGQQVDINVGTGSTLTGVSGAYADVGAGTGTTGDPFRIIERSPADRD